MTPKAPPFCLQLVSISISLSLLRYPQLDQKIHMASSLASMAARRSVAFNRLPSPRSASQAASIVQRRGLAGAADHHGTPKVNFWQDPTSPSKWKEEHFVLISLSGWGLAFYGAYKFFTGGNKKKEETLAVQVSH